MNYSAYIKPADWPSDDDEEDNRTDLIGTNSIILKLSNKFETK